MPYLFLIIGLVTFIFGFLLMKVKNKESLAIWIGKHFVIMGILLILVSILMFMLGSLSPLYGAILFFTIVILMSIIISLGIRKKEY